jgi:hypothetical protein
VEFLKSLTDFLWPHCGLPKRAFWQNEHKFLATIAASHIFSTHRAHQSLADRSHDLVPGRVSEFVVILFERIEIEHKDCQRTVFAASRMELVIEKLPHVATVVKTRERVRERVADCFEAERFAQAETGKGNADVFCDSCSELATARRDTRVGFDFRVGRQGVIVLDRQ